jgi:hypothetical protein
MADRGRAARWHRDRHVSSGTSCRRSRRDERRWEGGGELRRGVRGIEKPVETPAYAAAFLLIGAVGIMLLMPLASPLIAPGLNVDAWTIAKSLVAMLLVPLASGLAIRASAPDFARPLHRFVKLLAVVATLQCSPASSSFISTASSRRSAVAPWPLSSCGRRNNLGKPKMKHIPFATSSQLQLSAAPSIGQFQGLVPHLVQAELAADRLEVRRS